MANDATGTVVSGLASGSIDMGGQGVRQIAKSPSCDIIMSLMQTRGLNTDVPAGDMLDVLGIQPIRDGNHVGPYVGRFNDYERRKGSDYRVVLGRTAHHYRLIRIAQ